LESGLEFPFVLRDCHFVDRRSICHLYPKVLVTKHVEGIRWMETG